MLIFQIALMPPLTQEEKYLYNIWAATGKRHLPRAGGLLDQNEREMELLTRANWRVTLYELFYMDREARKQAAKQRIDNGDTAMSMFGSYSAR